MYQKNLFFAALLLVSCSLQGQSIKSKSTFSSVVAGFDREQKTAPTDLAADFFTVNQFGEAPFSVLFKDISTGEPTTWLWDFGDETTDTLQHPVHVFHSPGYYTIKLSVSNVSSTSEEKKVDYIRVMQQGGCDSLNFPLPGDLTLISIISNGSGYVSGNNSFGDLAKASYFEEYEGDRLLTGAIFQFAVAKRSFTNDIPVFFKVWKNDGIDGKPGTVMDSDSLPISQLVDDVNAEQPTVFFFKKQVSLDGPFYLGVELPQIFGDTLALFTNDNNDPLVGNGWQQDAFGDWYSYSDAQNIGSLNIDHAIFPIVCQANGIDDLIVQDQLFVFPNPANDKIFIASNGSIPLKGLVSVYDFSGKLVSEIKSQMQFPFSINTSSFSEGLYVVKLALEDRVFNLKFIIQHGTR